MNQSVELAVNPDEGIVDDSTEITVCADTESEVRVVRCPRFFENDDAQAHYEERVCEVATGLSRRLPRFYVPELHDELIRQLVRNEMMMLALEKRIFHVRGSEDATLPEWVVDSLENVRKQYNLISRNLMLDVKSIASRECKERPPKPPKPSEPEPEEFEDDDEDEDDFEGGILDFPSGNSEV